eukprot:TRINITY_DN20861_c0_g1::TRINITY_DN20861_c0_g1_i1::g.12440::m.12440 TRINITY_DN20861_c0_g1::TRINITY_DN20861_c0_g1_i1::g.12440  ORF type:complete len:327 (+),score=38.61,DUF4087/PF13316.1/0.013 TRINITY_DN20861_c0_g1_i1:3-983(+)
MYPVPDYCNNPEWDYVPVGSDLAALMGFSPTDIGCAIPTERNMKVNEFSFSAGTMVRESDAPRRSAFLQNIESFRVVLRHYISASFDLPTRTPRTLVMNKDGSLHSTFEPGEFINLRIQDYLDLADVKLDDENFQDFLLYSESPRYRHTGLQLLVRLEYTNMRVGDPWNTDLQCKITVTPTPGSWGLVDRQLSWFNGTVGEYSVSSVWIQFSIGGSVGQVSWLNVWLYTMSVVTLLALADAFLQKCGLSFVLTPEQLYEFKNHCNVTLDFASARLHRRFKLSNQAGSDSKSIPKSDSGEFGSNTPPHTSMSSVTMIQDGTTTLYEV